MNYPLKIFVFTLTCGKKDFVCLLIEVIEIRTGNNLLYEGGNTLMETPEASLLVTHRGQFD